MTSAQIAATLLSWEFILYCRTHNIQMQCGAIFTFFSPFKTDRHADKCRYQDIFLDFSSFSLSHDYDTISCIANSYVVTWHVITPTMNKEIHLFFVIESISLVFYWNLQRDQDNSLLLCTRILTIQSKEWFQGVVVFSLNICMRR